MKRLHFISIPITLSFLAIFILILEINPAIAVLSNVPCKGSCSVDNGQECIGGTGYTNEYVRDCDMSLGSSQGKCVSYCSDNGGITSYIPTDLCTCSPNQAPYLPPSQPPSNLPALPDITKAANVLGCSQLDNQVMFREGKCYVCQDTSNGYTFVETPKTDPRCQFTCVDSDINQPDPRTFGETAKQGIDNSPLKDECLSDLSKISEAICTSLGPAHQIYNCPDGTSCTTNEEGIAFCGSVQAACNDNNPFTDDVYNPEVQADLYGYKCVHNPEPRGTPCITSNGNRGYCDKGICVDFCLTAADCRRTEFCCNGWCVDPFSDSSNCGKCGKTCASGEACQFGACHKSCTNDPGYCVREISSGSTCCPGGYCASIAYDQHNCGECGKQCQADYKCTKGECVLSLYTRGCGVDCEKDEQCKGYLENTHYCKKSPGKLL